MGEDGTCIVEPWVEFEGCGMRKYQELKDAALAAASKYRETGSLEDRDALDKAEEKLHAYERGAAELIERAHDELKTLYSDWTKTPPSEQGAYWWWSGDEDSSPLHIEIMYSGSDGTYFATSGQYGWTVAQSVTEMGGWWIRIYAPKTYHTPCSRCRTRKLIEEIETLLKGGVK